MRGLFAGGDVVADRRVDGPEGPVMGDRLQEPGRRNQVRRAGVFRRKGRQIRLERLLPQVQQFPVRQEDVALEAVDPAARGNLAGYDRIPVRVVRPVHAALVEDAARLRVQTVQEDAAIKERVPASRKVRDAVLDEDAAADRPGRLNLLVGADVAVGQAAEAPR